MKGSCLCGGVVFEVTKVTGPFEICHCNRCRKVSGSQGMAAVAVQRAGYQLLAGESLIQSYMAPIIYGPPAYETYFCGRCGSPTPPAHPDTDVFEIPAGLLDDDVSLKPDKHIFVEYLPDWDTITDDLPQYDMRQLVQLRNGAPLPDDFVQKSHFETLPAGENE